MSDARTAAQGRVGGDVRVSRAGGEAKGRVVSDARAAAQGRVGGDVRVSRAGGEAKVKEGS